ncbi:MAG: hypothetical protein JXD22_12155 [Sedimentisphaerales bacterium]|nr:hypothetical protein [Sedimentisphaerales bacterium]
MEPQTCCDQPRQARLGGQARCGGQKRQKDFSMKKLSAVGASGRQASLVAAGCGRLTGRGRGVYNGCKQG